MYMECSKKHPAETSGKYNTVNVEIFEQTNFILFLQAQQMLIFDCIKFRL